MIDRVVWKRRIGRALRWIPTQPSRKIVLLYHAVGSGPRATSIAQFQKQIQWLTRVASVVPIDALLNGVTGAGLVVAITFDDGYSSVHDGALPVLAPMGLLATVYLNTSCIGVTSQRPAQPELGHQPGETFMRWSEAKALVQAGWTVGSHGVDHLDLTRSPADVCSKQLVQSRGEIIRRLDVDCVHFSYPWGRSTRQLRALVRQCGYRCAAGGRHGPLRPGFDLMAFPRINIAHDYSVEDFKAIVRGNWDYLGLVQRAKGWTS
jgi:peptidoglycan/xylan/chitin deacetylase (PgdA/CDA1 family)